MKDEEDREGIRLVGRVHAPDGAVSLAPQSRALWAKTGGGEERNLWSSLYVHMLDSMYVARKLWGEWLSGSVKSDISSFIGSESAAEALVSWLACIHDIGKATPAFQYKVLERAEFVGEMGLRLPSARMMNHPPSHATMGELILEEWLDSRGWASSRMFGSIIGAHHGASPTEETIRDTKIASDNFPIENLGDQEWESIQNELLTWAFEISGANEFENLFQVSAPPQSTQVLISALVIMSDWIASNSDFFPLIPCVKNYADFSVRAETAWSSLGLPSAWHAEDINLDKREFFRRRFNGLPENAELRQAQSEALCAALGMDGSGLLIIEAPMGNGKTEASLLCAEVLAAKSGAGGVAYLLPTMATSNAMFARVEEWLKAVPDSRGRSIQTMQLLHSKAALNPDYSKLQTWGSTWMGDGAEFCAEENLIAHQWFSGKKRGLLSSFVVGTVDQLLMAALKMRHVQLRHLGLAGKVVVIDEVHAYDAYMNTYLDRVLTWFGAYGIPTILLSATLPSARRNELIHAYRGRDAKSATRRSRRRDIPEAPREKTGRSAYPLITAISYEGALNDGMYRTCVDPSIGTDVVVRGIDDDDATLVALLDELLSGGGCACVLRNTVSRAQGTYGELKRAFGDSCVKLVHSRFIATDRMANDAELLRLLGPDSSGRSGKLIVVGTQVIEQSLDIDFDVMVTDIAPVDLMLQRIGRLHRHRRGEGQSRRPEKLRSAYCYVAGVENWDEVPPKVAKGIENVYPRALLLRSLLALWAKGDGREAVTINLPHDIAGLVELVYSPGDMHGRLLPDDCRKNWEDALRAADEGLQAERNEAQMRANAWLLAKPKKNRNASLVGWLRGSYSAMDEVKGRAAVRDSGESIEVVVVLKSNSGFELLPWVVDEKGNRPFGGALGDGSCAPDDEVARLAATCTVSLPPKMSMSWNYSYVVEALESQNSVPGWQESRWLRGQLVMAFDSSLSASIEAGPRIYHLCYSREVGLELVEPNEKGEDRQ